MNSQGGSLWYNDDILSWGAQTRPNRGRPAGWIRVYTICYMHGQFHSPTFTAHHVHRLRYFLETFPCARPTRAEIDFHQPPFEWITRGQYRQCACAVKDNLEKFEINCTKTLLQWNENAFLHWRHAFTPKDFQMHQQSLDHSYGKRETSLTKLQNSKSVMILVVRFASSPTQIAFTRISATDLWIACSARHCSRPRNVIASFATSRPNFGSWISELNLRRFELKMLSFSVMW
jgi:hypothetical protein